MRYAVEYEPHAVSDFRRLDREIAGKIRNRIEEMAGRCDTYSHYPLKGSRHRRYRLRYSAYRVLYTLDHANRRVTIVRVRHRRNSYRND